MKYLKKILLVLLIALTLTACGGNTEDTNKKEEEKIVKEDIKTGTVDGYTFTQTEEVTDRVKIQMENARKAFMANSKIFYSNYLNPQIKKLCYNTSVSS